MKKRRPAIGRPAATMAFSLHMPLLGLLVCAQPSLSASARIIGSDGKEHTFRHLRHPHHHARRAAKAKPHEVRMLNHPRHRHARVNVTLGDEILHSHLVTGGESETRQSQPVQSEPFKEGKMTVRMKLMHADWCTGLALDSPDFKNCSDFMGELCQPESNMTARVSVRRLCDKFSTLSGKGFAHFDLERVRAIAEGRRSASASASGEPAPMPAPPPEGADIEPAPGPAPAGADDPAPAPAPAPGPEGEQPEAKNAKFGRVNDMNAKSMMPEQGFSGKLVRHDDAETHLSDWQEEYGPKADHMSTKEICAMYPNNHWCKMNKRLMNRHKKRKYHYYTTTPSAASPAPAAEWHEHATDAVEDAGDAVQDAGDAVQDAGGAIADTVKGAHDTVKDWLGIGGEENETKAEEDDGEGVHEQVTESVDDAHNTVKDWLGAGDSGDGEDAKGSKDSSEGEGEGEGEPHEVVKDLWGAPDTQAGDSADGEDAKGSKDSSEGEGEGEGGAHKVVKDLWGAPDTQAGGSEDGEDSSAGATKDSSAGESKGEGEGEGAAEEGGSPAEAEESESPPPTEAPGPEKAEDSTTEEPPLYASPKAGNKEDSWWWPFSWP